MRFAACLITALIFASASWAGTQLEDLTKKVIANLERIATTLSTVQDDDTAKAATPELKKAADEFVVLKKKASDVPPPSKEEKDRLSKLYRAKLEDARKKLIAEVIRVQIVGGGRELLKVIAPVLEKGKEKDKSSDKSPDNDK